MQKFIFHIFIVLAGIFIPEKSFSQSGNLDTSFGEEGKLTISFGNFPHIPNELYSLPDGKTLIAGLCRQPSYNYYSAFLIRITQDGKIDSTFGNNGLATYYYETFYTSQNPKIAVQNDGKVILMMTHNHNFTFSANHITLLRFNPDGTRDSLFGINGKVQSVFGFNFAGKTIDITNDGKILIGGTENNNHNFAFVRFLSNGTKDNSLGGNGSVVVDMGELGSRVQCLSIEPDGKIFAAGPVYTGSLYKFGITKLNQDGSLDSTFGIQGKRINNYGGSYLTSDNMKVLPDGKIRLLGENDLGQGSYCTYQLQEDGSPDNTFGEYGVKVYNLPATFNSFRGSYLQNNGKALLGGISGKFMFMRINTEAELDTSFNETGVFYGDGLIQFDSIISCASLSQQSDGKVVALGQYSDINNSTANNKFALFRFLPDSVSSVSAINKTVINLSTHPNPTQNSFQLNYTLQESAPITINLYDQNGRKVQTLLPKSQRSAGNYSEQFNLQDLPAGIYSLELSTGKSSRAVQLVKQ